MAVPQEKPRTVCSTIFPMIFSSSLMNLTRQCPRLVPCLRGIPRASVFLLNTVFCYPTRWIITHLNPIYFLVVIDESHATVPQIGAMFEGDSSRKRVLVEHGFRLPSAMDNRPLK